MNIADRERKYMRMETITSVYGMELIQIIYFSMDTGHFIAKKEKLFIKEYGRIIDIKLMIKIRFKMECI